MVSWLLLLLPAYIVCRLCGGSFHVWGRWFYSGLLWLANIRVHQHWPSEPLPAMIRVADAPTLFVGNHVSFLDIAVVAAHAEVAFVAATRGNIPKMYQFIADLGDTIFVSRKNWRAIGEQIRNVRRVKTIHSRRLVLFGEGTTSDGSSILPFRSSLFASVIVPKESSTKSTDTARDAFGVENKIKKIASNDSLSLKKSPPLDTSPHHLTDTNTDIADLADIADIMVQPFALFYRSYAGIPLTPDLRDVFAWYGEMSFWPHFWRLLSLPGPLDIDLMWRPIIDPNTLIPRAMIS